MYWVAKALGIYPKNVVVIRYPSYFGPGYDLGFEITSQMIVGGTRIIKGIPYMAYGGSMTKTEITFRIPAWRFRVYIKGDVLEESYWLTPGGRSKLRYKSE